MAKVRLKEKENKVEIEVGDLIIGTFGERLIVGPYGKYFGVNPKDMKICGVYETLKEAELLYCKDEYRIIKGKNLTIVEE